MKKPETGPLAWTKDESVLKKYPMLRVIARDLLAAFRKKGIDPRKLGKAEVEGQENTCNGTTGSGYGVSLEVQCNGTTGSSWG